MILFLDYGATTSGRDWRSSSATVLTTYLLDIGRLGILMSMGVWSEFCLWRPNNKLRLLSLNSKHRDMPLLLSYSAMRSTPTMSGHVEIETLVQMHSMHWNL